jgi:hypothetical protein
MSSSQKKEKRRKERNERWIRPNQNNKKRKWSGAQRLDIAQFVSYRKIM